MINSERDVPVNPGFVPASMGCAVAGMKWARDTVGEAGAAVYRLHAPGRPTLYLKHGQEDVAEDITAEMIRMRWLCRHTPTPEVLGFVSSSAEAWLLMSAIPGRTAYQLLEAEPDNRIEVVTALAQHLRKLHGIAADACPFNSHHPLRLAEARLRIDAGVVDETDFDDAHEDWTAERVWSEMTALLPIELDPVVTHGDYSLDNILLEGGQVTGTIDLSRARVADRYQDLAILWNCLGEFGDDLQNHLFAAYGIEQPDKRKLRFHLALDEFF